MRGSTPISLLQCLFLALPAVAAVAAGAPDDRPLAPPSPDDSEEAQRGPKIAEKFLLTDRPQQAVFVTTAGWTGGMGQPVLDPGTGEIRRYQGLPIFISGELENALSSKLPEQCSGRLYLIVSADIQLVRKTERNASIPGAPRETYWQVKLHKLRDVQVQVLPD